MISIKLHLLTHPKFLGDKNQALGIKAALEKICPYKINSKIWNVSASDAINAIQHSFNSDTESHHIVIAVGDHGIKALSQLHDLPKNVIAVWSGHQLFPELSNLLSKLNIVALPTHILDLPTKQSFAKESELVETIGVAHNVNQEEIATAFAAWQSKKQNAISNKNQYIAVILGGDAPEPNGKMRYFTAQEATLLGEHLVKLANQNNHAHLLIVNSPRTGKFDPLTQKEQKVHTGEMIDKTSSALLDTLQNNNISYQFFDFVVGQPSAYQAVLGAISGNKNNIVVVTGDSTSMITEISDTLTDHPLFIVNTGSMNESHFAHVRSVNEAGYASLITLNEQRQAQVHHPAIAQSNQHQTAADKIAKSIKVELTKNINLKYNQEIILEILTDRIEDLKEDIDEALQSIETDASFLKRFNIKPEDYNDAKKFGNERNSLSKLYSCLVITSIERIEKKQKLIVSYQLQLKNSQQLLSEIQAIVHANKSKQRNPLLNQHLKQFLMAPPERVVEGETTKPVTREKTRPQK